MAKTFVQAELEVLRRRSERAMNAMQTVSEELAPPVKPAG